ncbi:hypothetical protein AB0E04_38140 [Streptomyces sp. NPDC048251]|uniref:hypothetical protein n=1 Tax=unclassified Streptomyces TaxID=2593676 RepID=UPI003243F678
MQRASTAISDEVRGFLDKSLWGTGQNNLGTGSSPIQGSATAWPVRSAIAANVRS